MAQTDKHTVTFIKGFKIFQVYQIIEYLGRKHNITCEGIFRKHGNLKKQQALKERLNKVKKMHQFYNKNNKPMNFIYVSIDNCHKAKN